MRFWRLLKGTALGVIAMLRASSHMLRAMEWDYFLNFASPAKQMALVGGALLLLAAIAGFAEAVRMRRARIDRVGWVPWTAIVILCAVLGAGMLAMAVPVIIKG